MNRIPFWQAALCLCGRALTLQSEKRTGFCTRCRPGSILTPAYKQRRQLQKRRAS